LVDCRRVVEYGIIDEVVVPKEGKNPLFLDLDTPLILDVYIQRVSSGRFLYDPDVAGVKSSLTCTK
jgi:hypothetical protein